MKLKLKGPSNFGLKALSLLVACLIWLMVTNTYDPESTRAYRNVPITIKNQDTITNANKTFTVVDDVEKVYVYVTARKSIQSKLSSASFTVKADLENYNEALGTVPLEVSCSDAQISQEDIRLVPSSIKLKLEDKVEESFTVGVTTSGKTEKGYELGKTTLVNGDTILIAGPQSLIKIIGKVTVAVDLTNMSVSSESAYPIKIEDKNGSTLTESQMSNLDLKDANGVSLQDQSVEVATEIWQVYSDIPVEVNVLGEPAEGYRVSSVSLTPRTVSLTAAEGTMDQLEGTLTLKDTISVQGLTESQEYTLDLNDTLDDYDSIRLEADASSTITVKIEIDEVGSKTYEIPVSDITMKNVPKDKKLIFSPADYLPVTVRVSEEEETTLTQSDIKTEIDLQNCEINGSYTLPVTVTLPDGYELVSEPSIVVNIEDVENETEVEAVTEE